jgi:hypothetical protein
LPRTTRNVAETARKGDRKETLIALRDRLAEAIDCTTDAAELSSLALRLQRTLEQIEDLGGADKREEEDDLAARRDAKLRAAAGT